MLYIVQRKIERDIYKKIQISLSFSPPSSFLLFSMQFDLITMYYLIFGFLVSIFCGVICVCGFYGCLGISGGDVDVESVYIPHPPPSRINNHSENYPVALAEIVDHRRIVSIGQIDAQIHPL